MPVIEPIWERIKRHAGEQFETVSGLSFTFEVPGNYLRVTRDGEQINRSLSRTNFARSLELMPAAGPGALKESQGASYTWAILMDPRIRRSDW